MFVDDFHCRHKNEPNVFHRRAVVQCCSLSSQNYTETARRFGFSMHFWSVVLLPVYEFFLYL